MTINLVKEHKVTKGISAQYSSATTSRKQNKQKIQQSDLTFNTLEMVNEFAHLTGLEPTFSNIIFL